MHSKGCVLRGSSGGFFRATNELQGPGRERRLDPIDLILRRCTTRREHDVLLLAPRARPQGHEARSNIFLRSL